MSVAVPQKKHFRQRPHSSQITDRNFNVPLKPDDVNVDEFFPNFQNGASKKIEIVDIGCGYGGLLFDVSKTFPDKLALGMEIRDKVKSFVEQKIQALRTQNECQNIWVVQTNAMKYYHNYFSKDQLCKIFVLFPDPHFKPSKHNERIIRKSLLDEYAYTLKPEGRFYLATDVEAYFHYAENQLETHPLFVKCTEEELKDDVMFNKLQKVTDEGVNVTREGGSIYKLCYKHVFPSGTDSTLRNATGKNHPSTST